MKGSNVAMMLQGGFPNTFLIDTGKRQQDELLIVFNIILLEVKKHITSPELS